VSINFARLNHILIPTRKEGRDRLRKTFLGRMTKPIAFVFGSLSAEGKLFATASFLAIGFGFEVHTTEAYLLWCALSSLVLVSLLFVRLFRMEKVELEVTAPRRVTVGEMLTFTIEARNDGPRDHHAVRLSGPFLPWDGRWAAASPAVVAELPAGARAKVEMRARFSFRGEHHLDPFHARELLPLGLALGPAIETGGCRFLVVPKIADVARVTTPLGRRHQPGGVALASKTGESMDLLGVRPYRPGDPVRDLHARSWARLGTPVVREYQQEYFSRVGVVLDTDEGVASERQKEAAISLAAGIVATLSRGEALIDVIVVGSQVHTLTVGRSLGYFEQALDLLACVEEKGAFDGEDLLSRLAPHLPQLACVLFVALAWDEARAAFYGRVQQLGVGCSAVVVEREPQRFGSAPAKPGYPDGVRGVEVLAIERGETLLL
jgi:uncharacterized protein (DUF58 family)